MRFTDASDRARVLLRGKDARTFLHRMSTQHVTEMKAGESRRNVLTTDKGRVVDLVHLLDRGDDGLLLVGSRGRGETIRAWLDRYLFTEDVQIEDVTGQGALLEVIGDAPAGSLAIPTFPRGGPTCFALVPEVPAGAVDAATWEAERVAYRIVGELELNEKWNPLDLGLTDAIHWNKGCYIGQEVIARLDTYQKQHRRLVGITVDPAGIAPGAPVLVEGTAVGEVTSVSPTHNQARPSVLAVVKGAVSVVSVGDRAGVVVE